MSGQIQKKVRTKTTLFYLGMSDEQAFKACQRFVSYSFKYASREEQEDYTQVALIMYFKVINYVDPDKGNVDLFVRMRVKGAILDYKRSLYGREGQKDFYREVFEYDGYLDRDRGKSELLDYYNSLARILSDDDMKFLDLFIKGYKQAEIARVFNRSGTWANLKVVAISFLANFIRDPESEKGQIYKKILDLKGKRLDVRDYFLIGVSENVYIAISTLINSCRKKDLRPHGDNNFIVSDQNLTPLGSPEESIYLSFVKNGKNYLKTSNELGLSLKIIKSIINRYRRRIILSEVTNF